MNDKYPQPGQPFSLQLQAVADSTGAATLETEPVEAGELWAVSHVFISDADNNATVIKMYAGRIGALYLVDEWPSITKNTGRTHADAFYLADGEYLRVTVTGATEADKITVQLIGEKRGRGGPEIPVVITT